MYIHSRLTLLRSEYTSNLNEIFVDKIKKQQFYDEYGKTRIYAPKKVN